MIKDFQGQVKVADIQAAFDEIVDRINKQVDIYNNAAGYGDIDYTKGSPKLGSGNYTLTIGGLKSVINSYNGTLIGCKAYRLNDTSILVSDGLYFKDGHVYRINSRVIAGEADWDLSDLYYDIDNDTVMFKNGSTSDIVEVQTGWTQPTINSNTDCGVFSASSNSQSAYKITTNDGWNIIGILWNNWADVSGTVTWNLPKTIKVSNISFTTTKDSYGGTSETFGGYISINGTRYRDISLGANNIALDNVEASSISITISGHAWESIGLAIKNLVVTGNANSYAIETGGVITPSDNIIKISHLNWESGELILNSLEGFQLEGFHDVKLTSQNRGISAQGLSDWDYLDTSNSGKFVAYLAPFSNANMTYTGTSSFMGIHLAGAETSNNNVKQHHYSAAPISLIYVPKGATISDSRTQWGARNVFNSKLSK